MESINLDLDDLMEPVDELEDDVDFPVVSALPALDDNDENLLDTSVQQNDGLLDTLLDPGGGQEGEAPAKKTVNRKPIPKLDAARLTGERGLPALLKHFEKVKFKGKGHEVSDLDRLMRTLEHWAHRLFPKMPFDDVIERIEKLGSKKPVQTCLKKIRLDMPLLDEDFVTRGEDEATAANDADIVHVGAEGDDIFPTQPPNSTQQPPALNIDTPKVTMTDEQKERIERNKRLAMEKRLAKQQQDNTSSQQQMSSQTTGLQDSELDDLITMEMGRKTSQAANQDGIDSEEEEIEREMWSQMMGETKKGDSKKEGKVPGKRKEDEVCEIDSDDAELENEIWNQMTEPIPTQPEKPSQGLSQDESSQVPLRKRRRVILDDDDDDEDDDVIECEKTVAPKDICNEMTEPLLTQTQKDSKKVDQEVTSAENDPAKVEEGNEIWNQMTEPIPTQSAEGSQRQVGNLKSAVSDGSEDSDGDDAGTKTQGDTKGEVDICNEMTEPVDTDVSVGKISQIDGHEQKRDDVAQSMETFVEQDDVDLDDSSMWTQITSTNPADDIPSTNPEDSVLSTNPGDIPKSSGKGEGIHTESTGKSIDKDVLNDDIEEEEESQSIFVGAVASKKRKMIISDDDDD